jgi:D-alanyl-lipoteichoic acid acyltransferase DltB (MBOAT superfamily)
VQELLNQGLSLTNPLYACILLIAPVILGNSWRGRRLAFCALNICVLVIAAQTTARIFLLLFWALLPYFALRAFARLRLQKTTPFLITAVVISFAYLQHYDWIFTPLHISYLTAWKVVGISYMLFRQIDFIVQYDQNCKKSVPITLIDDFNFQFSFYTILCGPIVRYRDFVLDFYAPKLISKMPQILSNISRILNGFIKIYLVSAVLDFFVHACFEHFASAWLLVILSNIWYIYFNFSGFMDVMIASAALAGVHLPENFNRPYLARDISDFWSRWHITLSSWIRDYIYTPIFRFSITINRKFASYFALFVAFFVAGIWHGTTINYLIYGVLLGIFAALSALYIASQKKKRGRREFLEFRTKRWVRVAETACTWLISSACIIFVGLDIIGRLLN